MSARKLAEHIIAETDLRHLDAQGGAWFAMEMIEVLEGAEAIGWTLTPPSPDQTARERDELPTPGPFGTAE